MPAGGSIVVIQVHSTGLPVRLFPRATAFAFGPDRNVLAKGILVSGLNPVPIRPDPVVSARRDFGALGAVIANIRAGLQASEWARMLPKPGSCEIWKLRNTLPRAMLVAPDGFDQPCDLVSYRRTSISVTCHALGEASASRWLARVNGAP